MNRYYTETIPADLARALKDKGMPLELTTYSLDCVTIMEDSSFAWLDIELGQKPEKVERHYKRPKFSEVFDWFANKGVCICMTCTRRAFRMALGYGYVVQTIDKFYASESNSHTWEKSAIRAIGKALELI